MSGGRFDYQQFRINDIAREIEEILKTDEINDYSPETIKKFEEAILTLKRAEIMAQRVDWLVSGDDGEESFHQRWEEDLKELSS